MNSKFIVHYTYFAVINAANCEVATLQNVVLPDVNLFDHMNHVRFFNLQKIVRQATITAHLKLTSSNF